MSDPIFSPDGNWMWSGSEWIPAPPNGAPSKMEIDIISNNEMASVGVQNPTIASNENVSTSVLVDTDRNKSANIFIALIVLVGASVGGYLLMDRPLEYENGDYWSALGYGYRFTDNDVYFLASPIDGQECEELINDDNWTSIEEKDDFCVFDSISFNAISEKGDFHSLCIASDCIRLDFRGNGLFLASILDDGNVSEDCISLVKGEDSVNFSSIEWKENFSEKIVDIRLEHAPEHCKSFIEDRLQQNAQLTGSEVQQEISGKINIITIWVGNQTAGSEKITLVFALAAGSNPMDADQINWEVICDGGADTTALVDGDFTAATTLDGATAVATFAPGDTYMVDLVVGGGAGASCAPALNEQHRMVISTNGGGTTYEILSYTSINEGDSVV